jgi:hypothetical protein
MTNPDLSSSSKEISRLKGEVETLTEHKRLLFEENGRLLAERESGQWDKNWTDLNALKVENERLKGEVERLDDGCRGIGYESNLEHQVQTLKARCERYRKALEFYAKNDIHTKGFDWVDNGAKAREALKESEGEKG